MGLFEKLGRKAERFRQQVEDAADETYECRGCGEVFAADYDDCPECGGEVEPVERGDEPSPGDRDD